MSYSRSAGKSWQRGRSTLTALVVAAATLIAVFGCRPLTGSSSRALPSATPSTYASQHFVRGDIPREPGRRPGGGRLGLGVADGAIPNGVTVFDDNYPGVTRLDPALLAALRRAATAARDDDGVLLYVNSGWRSAAYQEQLLDQAVSKYGSRSEAARWVSTPGTSAHVSGDAVDIGPSDATAWLSEHGAAYGLCQIYGNEPWHYELRTNAAQHGCPPMYADPTHDPRMQR
ncbi:MAG: zinc D-Ala-D-Ala carboxypeptidase [Nocardioidaceae bacterium]|nr:zinc D-Ala-D-Ala carboxypeptidase [Nocardioidaceae bacterium]